MGLQRQRRPSKKVGRYEETLEFILAEKKRAIQRLADQIRTEVVLPACVRHGLTYRSGNGDYAFGDPKIHDYSHPRYSIGDDHGARSARLGGLVEVFKVLDLSVDEESHATIGHYVEDVTEEQMLVARRSEEF